MSLDNLVGVAVPGSPPETPAALDEALTALAALPPDELAAKSAPPPKTSSACSRCPAACCRRFWMQLKIKVLPQRGHRHTPWHERVRFVWLTGAGAAPEADRAFMTKYFRVSPDNENLRRRRTTKRGCWGTAWRHEPKPTRRPGISLTCLARNGNQCGKYAERPAVCRGHLCDSAIKDRAPHEEQQAHTYPGYVCTSALRRQFRSNR